jgi:hypothetical protein
MFCAQQYSMLYQEPVSFINGEILRMVRKLEISYSVADNAPATEHELLQHAKHLVIWSGASDKTIYQDASVNWAFRAWHDRMHVQTGLSFAPGAEIELGRIQAAQCDSALMQDLIYCEVARQVMVLQATGEFVADQFDFTVKALKGQF